MRLAAKAVGVATRRCPLRAERADGYRERGDGLCAGKGVVIAHTRGEALAAAEAMLSGEAFGAAGRRIVVEAFLDGEEASFIALCDGRDALPLQSSQDHKAGTAIGAPIPGAWAPTPRPRCSAPRSMSA